MAVRWSFLEFDWERFRAVAPQLQRAVEQGDLEAIDLPEAESLFGQLGENASAEEACNTLVAALCGVGEPVTIETGLPELLRRMRRVRTGESAAETLGELISAGPGIAPWFEARTGLAGILDVTDTFALAVGLSAYHDNHRPPAAPHGVAAWTRRFLPTEAADERMGELIDLARLAAERNHGLAALCEE